jgi:hypothetical protein
MSMKVSLKLPGQNRPHSTYIRIWQPKNGANSAPFFYSTILLNRELSVFIQQLAIHADL